MGIESDVHWKYDSDFDPWPSDYILGVPSMSILSRDPDLSRKPPELRENRLLLERTMVEKNGESTPRCILCSLLVSKGIYHC